ncbi:hypothetical protein FGG78_25640 [Thioclava sp. BHET1]|nr:hypothetical protein FGG78_25640 [Thioclava sp. BHET1]
MLGGGPSAVMICGLGFCTWRVFGYWRDSQDARIADAQKHAEDIIAIQKDTVEAINAITQSVKDQTREIAAK